MSFSKEIKRELLEIELADDDQAFAFLSGIIASIGNVEFVSGGAKIFVTTDVEGLYDYLNHILKSLYGDFAEMEIVEKSIINKTLYYQILFPEDKAIEILKDTGLLNLTKKGYEFINSFDPHILNTQENIVAFLRAVFLTSSTNSIKLSEKAEEKTASGYHLEFTSHNEIFINQLSEMLALNGIFARKIERKKLFVLYLKDSQSISDLFAFLGANDAVLLLQNEIVTREKRNLVNRQINIISANISKTVDANFKQLEAIEIISSTIGLDALSEELQEIALLRLANQEESLSDLVKLSSISLTKSGINHRMRKIIKIAEELVGEEGEN